MNLTRRIFRHTAIQIVARAISTVLGLVTISIMTRSLGQSGFGAYTTITAYLSSFAVLVDFGISTTAVAMLSEPGADEESIGRNALGLRVASTAACMLLAIALVPLTPYTHDIQIGISILAISFLATAATQIQTAIFQRHVRMEYPSYAEIAGRLLLVAGISLVAWYHAGLFAMLAVVLIANVLQAILGALFLHRVTKHSLPAWSLTTWRHILTRAWPVGVAIVFNLLYLRADVVILSFHHSQAEVGLYGAAYRVIDVLTVLPMMFMGIILPFLTDAWSRGDKPRFSRVLTRALDGLSLGAAFILAVTLPLGPDLLAFIAGEEFRASGDMLRVLVFGVAAIFIAAAFTHAALAAHGQKKMLLPLAIDAGLSLLGYAIFIPRFGAWGAAYVTVFSEVFACVAAIVVTLRVSRVHLTSSLPWKMLVVTTLTLLLTWPTSSLPWPVRLVLITLIFGGLSFLLRAITPAFLRELLSFRDETRAA